MALFNYSVKKTFRSSAMRTFPVVLNLVKKTCSNFKFMIIKNPFSMFLFRGATKVKVSKIL